jgi:hypothetical protein
MSSVIKEKLNTSDFVATGESAQREHREERGEQIRTAETGGTAALLSQNSAQDLRGGWDRIQAGFVDDPRSSVKQADELVASAMKRLAEGFADQRANLERQWDRGEDVSTEDLRLALQKYRSFFQRLLAA